MEVSDDIPNVRLDDLNKVLNKGDYAALLFAMRQHVNQQLQASRAMTEQLGGLIVQAQSWQQVLASALSSLEKPASLEPTNLNNSRKRSAQEAIPARPKVSKPCVEAMAEATRSTCSADRASSTGAAQTPACPLTASATTASPLQPTPPSSPPSSKVRFSGSSTNSFSSTCSGPGPGFMPLPVRRDKTPGLLMPCLAGDQCFTTGDIPRLAAPASSRTLSDVAAVRPASLIGVAADAGDAGHVAGPAPCGSRPARGQASRAAPVQLPATRTQPDAAASFTAIPCSGAQGQAHLDTLAALLKQLGGGGTGGPAASAGARSGAASTSTNSGPGNAATSTGTPAIPTSTTPLVVQQLKAVLCRYASASAVPSSAASVFFSASGPGPASTSTLPARLPSAAAAPGPSLSATTCEDPVSCHVGPQGETAAHDQSRLRELCPVELPSWCKPPPQPCPLPTLPLTPTAAVPQAASWIAATFDALEGSPPPLEEICNGVFGLACGLRRSSSSTSSDVPAGVACVEELPAAAAAVAGTAATLWGSSTHSLPEAMGGC